MINTLTFDHPTIFQRIKSMLSVDFYRLIHTPMLYIFLAISAFIPAMILGMTGTGSGDAMFNNTWQMVASIRPIYTVNDIGEYANMNMVFIFGGIMVSIFIGHDYRSGYVKQLFTSHAHKSDYMISKSLSCAVAMIAMCVMYLVGTIVAGLFVGASFEVNVGSLIFAILGKMIMSFGWASFYTMLNVILRRYFGFAIAASFFFGTGIIIIGLAGAFGNSTLLNVFLYGSSVYACLSANFVSLLVCILCSFVWAIIYNLLGTLILSKCDVY